jgi:hypothetical protein
MAINGKNKESEFFITTKDENGKFWTYESLCYKLTEIDLLNLIRMCFVHKRSITIGEKLIAIYRDCKKEADKNLKNIGVPINEKPKPNRTEHSSK